MCASRTEDNHEEFFSSTHVPDDIDKKQAQMEDFVKRQEALGNRVVLVSSGGTTVPLETRTVRFIDNFSVGTRGSASAEYFLQNKYAVIFLHRHRSLEPYARHVNRHIIDRLEVREDTVVVKTEHTASLKNVLQQYQVVKDRGMLLQVEFTSLSEYLHLLRLSAQVLNTLREKAMLYLAAAVSDFYIPKQEMPEHKIQSSTNKPLQLSLQLVPKMLEPLVKNWAPMAYVVSFKLETDSSLLLQKSHMALEKYQHQVVVGNILETRKHEVVLVTTDSDERIKLSEDDLSAGTEIEEYIIAKLVHFHDTFCKNS